MKEYILETELLEVDKMSNFGSLLGEGVEIVITNPDVILILCTYAIGLGIIATVIHLWKYKS